MIEQSSWSETDFDYDELGLDNRFRQALNIYGVTNVRMANTRSHQTFLIQRLQYLFLAEQIWNPSQNTNIDYQCDKL